VLEGHAITVDAVSMTPDGRMVVSGAGDNTVMLWDLETGECERVLKGPNTVRAVSITPDGRRAVSGSHDGTVRLWDLETGSLEYMTSLDTLIDSLAFSGVYLAVGTRIGGTDFYRSVNFFD
jgi:WD40 repeat protein